MRILVDIAPGSLPPPRDAERDAQRELRRRIERAAQRLRAAPDDEAALAALADVGRFVVEWREGGGTVQLGKAREEPREGAREAVPPLLAEILAGLLPSTSDVVELDRLHAAVRGTQRWSLLPRELQRQVLALVVARLRRLQDEVSISDPRLEEAFSMLTAWSKAAQPGFVIGLSRHHHPVRGTWGEDAEAWWERVSALPALPVVPAERVDALVDEVEAVVARLGGGGADDARRLRAALCQALDGGVSPRNPRLISLCAPLLPLLDFRELRGLRQALREESEVRSEAAGAAHPLPVDWRWAARVRGRRAVAVVGELAPEVRDRIVTALDLLELETFPNDEGGRAAVAARMVDGTSPLVFAPAPAGNREGDPVARAFREHRADWVMVDLADGLARVRRGVERYLDPVPRRG